MEKQVDKQEQKNVTSFGVDARKQLIKGVNTVGNAVKVTMGAKGRNVIIQNYYNGPHITKDGVTVAKAINIDDPIEKMGVQMIQEVANRTMDLAGDGTTCTTVLAQTMINIGLKAIESGAAPIDVKRGIEKTVEEVVKILKTKSTKIEDNEALLKSIATISANNDEFIGGLIFEAIEKVGKKGLITIGESKSNETYIELVEGMQFDRGYLSPYFVTDAEKMVVEFENCYLLLYDKKITSLKPFQKILNEVLQQRQPILIICEDIEGEALGTLVVNRLNGIQLCVVKAPFFGDHRKAVLEDIAVLTDGVLMAEDKGLKPEDMTLAMLGKTNRVTVTKDVTKIISDKGDKSTIADRCIQLKTQIDEASSDYDKEKLQERLAKLTTGAAVLKVGGLTDTEIREKKDRVDDAVCATRSAIEEGFVVGGGCTYLSILKDINVEYSNEDEKVGGDIVKKALEAPFRQILDNGGIEASQYIKEITTGEYGTGFNIKTMKVENLLESGIIDPTKVLRVALENASSIAGIFLTTECVITNEFKMPTL